MIKGCGVRQYLDHKYCERCGVCWSVAEMDAPPCGLMSAEFVAFYIPVVILASLAAWLLSPTLGALVAFGLICYAGADVSRRGSL